VHPPRLAIEGAGDTSVERVVVDVRSAPQVSWITIELGARHRRRFMRAEGVPLEVPAGTRIVGMLVRDRDGGSTWATPQPAFDVEAARPVRGDLMLAWVGTSGGQEHTVLRVTAPATVELAVELPRLARLAIDPAPGMRALEVRVDGAVRARVQAPRTRTEVALADVRVDDGPRSYAHLGRHTVLLPERSTAIGVMVASVNGPEVSFSPDKTIIRRVIKAHRNRLRQCYARVAQRDPAWAFEGTATVMFTIEADGTVPTASVDSVLPAEIGECLAGVARTWAFPPSDGRVVVNYPLTFRLAR